METTDAPEDDGENAYCPDNGYPRLIRFDLPDNPMTNQVSQLDDKFNLLRINKVLYDKLTSLQQNIVFKTKKEQLFLIDLVNY